MKKINFKESNYLKQNKMKTIDKPEDKAGFLTLTTKLHTDRRYSICVIFM